MRIKEITLNNFGKYKNNRTPLEFKPGINIVFGMNEAGKSTLFNGILTLLYGFKPANREAHPYLGWGENKIELSGIFEDNEGDLKVERKLMSSPSGFLFKKGKETKINNKTLDQVQDMTKQTYESIYALTLKDIVKMEATPWSEVEDRLILNYGIDSIKSPREVLLDIEEEMKILFNPRGQAKNTRVKQLENEIKELKSQRKQMIEKQHAVIEKEEKLKVLESDLEIALNQEVALEKRVQWWEKHQNIIDLTIQLEGATAQAMTLSKEIGNIPEGVMDYELLLSKLERHYLAHKELEKALYLIEQRLYDLTVNEEICIEHQNTIRNYLKSYLTLEQEMALHLQSKEFVEEKKRQLKQLVSDVVADVTNHQVTSLATFNLMAIESKIERVATLSKDSEALQKELYATKQQPKGNNILLGIALMCLGVGLFGLGLYFDQPLINYLAVLILSFSGFSLMNIKNKNFIEDIKIYDEKINFNTHKIEEETLHIQQQLAFLGISKEDVMENGQRLLTLLKTAKGLAQELLEKEMIYTTKEEVLVEQKNKLDESIQTLQFEGGRPTQTQLQTLLEEAVKKEQHNERINIDGLNKRQSIEESERALNLLKEKKILYCDYLNLIGKGNIKEGLALLGRFNKLKEKIEFLKEQLITKDPGCVMQESIKQIEQNQLYEQNSEENHIRLREIRETVEVLKLEKRTLMTDLDYLLKDVDIFDIESQLLAYEEELEEVKETYDKLLLLKTLVIAYDQEYREIHQPDIHKRTGVYFNQITKGKYPKIYNDESIDKTSLLIRQDGEDREADISLSQGARDQLYLSLRLALADELDKGKESLPIFLDELFVNWDIGRLEEGIELLKTLSQERQIILFTCHEWMVEKVKSLVNPHIIMLDS